MNLHSLIRASLSAVSMAAFGIMLVGAAPMAHAETDQDVVRSGNSARTVVNSFNNCVRTKWMSAGDPCAPPAPPAPKPVVQQTHVVIAQEERTIYFDFNKALLTDEAKRKLESLAVKLKSDRQVKQARIVGYADRIGRADYNEKLSRKRAENVRDYLIERGFINIQVAETRWLGDTAPSTHCAENLPHAELVTCLQQDRKVEVEIDYLPQPRPSTIQ